MLQISEIIGFLIFGLIALFLTFLVTPMVPAHLMLAARNQTSIEGNYTNMPNPFDRGSCAANFAEVFGSYGPDWLIPLTPTRPLSGGHMAAALPCQDSWCSCPAGVWWPS